MDCVLRRDYTADWDGASRAGIRHHDPRGDCRDAHKLVHRLYDQSEVLTLEIVFRLQEHVEWNAIGARHHLDGLKRL